MSVIQLGVLIAEREAARLADRPGWVVPHREVVPIVEGAIIGVGRRLSYTPSRPAGAVVFWKRRPRLFRQMATRS